jgi:molybdenum cofactor cytidylyltransferase
MDALATIPSVAGVVLAAGSSSRMGRNKLLLELDGEPLVRRTVGRALAAGLDPVIVVLGFDAERVAAALSGLSCRTILNPGHAGGMGGSMRLGIASVPPGASAAVVVLADMPFVTAEMLRALVDAHRERGTALVASRYGDVTAPPTLYGTALFPEFATLQDDACGRALLRRHAEGVVFLAWPETALADVDRPEDYERLRAAAARQA